jgi:hypothetical protein
VSEREGGGKRVEEGERGRERELRSVFIDFFNGAFSMLLLSSHCNYCAMRESEMKH